MSQDSNRGWSVTLAGTGINLALGVLYTWSVISKGIPDSWGWSEADRSLPYTVACLVFAIMMVPAGRLQDRYGPRLVATLGGIMTGLGLIMASRFQSVPMFIVGFGLLAGSGIGFGYAAATPPAVKWFPPAKTGMIAGIVVSGFGLANVYAAPLAKYLIKVKDLQFMMLFFGVAFLVVVAILAQLLVNPPPKEGAAATSASDSDFSVGEMLKTPQFYMVWLMYAFNAGAGLMVIGKLAKLASTQAAYEAGFIFVALLAIGNAGGRLLAGSLSDKMGRMKVLLIFTTFQTLLMFSTPFMSNWMILIVFSMCIGMNYGSNLALFPSITKDYFGLKNFGVNYGFVFTAWGAGSLLALVAGIVYDRTKSFKISFFIAGALLIVTLILSFIVKKPEKAGAAS